MALFKKKITEQELGKIIYDNIRYEVMSQDGVLSHISLMKNLEENPNMLKPLYIIELIIGLLFGSLLSIEKKYQHPKAAEIMDSNRFGFLKHTTDTFEISEEQLNLLIAKRFESYYECLKNQSGSGYVWHLGKQYHWNIIGEEKLDNPSAPMFAGLFIFKATELVDQIMKDYKIV